MMPKNNTFRRMTGLCGMTVADAAEYLDIALSTAEQKMAGLRGIKPEEEEKLVALWKQVRSGENLNYVDMPSNILLRQIAWREMRAIEQGKPMTPAELAWPADSLDENEPARDEDAE